MSEPKYEVVAARPANAGDPPRCYSCREVAAIMTFRGMPMSRARVWQLEQRALAKLAENRSLQEFADPNDETGSSR